MKSVRYACTHCGRKFEAEEKEIVECPGCFWTSSVKKEEELRDEPKSEPALPETQKNKYSFVAGLRWILIPISVIVVLVILAIAVAFALPAVSHLAQSVQSKFSKPSKLRIQKPEKRNPASTPPAAEAPSGLPSLTPQEISILQAKVTISADRTLTPEEENILKRRASFRTGFVEKLPAQAWTLAGFQKFIAGQEHYYKVLLPRSYKKKLEQIFNQKYTPASEAFKNGDLLKARNLWVESLIFPIYANDIQKHRGVVLTMLRSFIDDTLSKIGAVNSTLVEGKIRESETKITQNYDQLLKAVDQKDWKQSASLIETLNADLARFGQPDSKSSAAPDYPPTVQQVDEGIRAAMFQLLNVPPPAVADLEPIRQDVQSKKKVVEGLLPDQIEKVQAKYNEAVRLIDQKQWAEAEKKLSEINSPPAVAEDAAKKIAVIKKIKKEQ